MDEMALNKNGEELPEGLVYNEYNRNYYQAVEIEQGITWADANAAATGMAYGQCKSHLATITSANENAWLTANFPDAIEGGYWLGGQQAEGASDPAAGWGWVTGENWLYTNWEVIEPNDFGGIDEESLQFFRPVFDGFTEPGTWNDGVGETEGAFGYVVEYECPTKVTGGGGEGGHLGFVAQKGSDTSVKGQASVGFVNGVKIHIDVTCQAIWGTSAWAGGVTTKSNDDNYPTGTEFWWRVVDNGEGAKDENDQLGFFFFAPNNFPIAQNCALMQDGEDFPNAGVLFAWENGNFQVH
jgi:hypothetical protein